MTITHPDPPPQGLQAFTELGVQTLVTLLDELGIDRVTVVGNSMGGIISLALVLAHPDRVERLVLLGAGGAPVGFTDALLKLLLFYEDPTEAALAYARKHLLPHSASSLRLAVRAARGGLARRFRKELAEVERIYLEDLMSTADANEGLKAFLEKREPAWKNE